MMNFIGKSALVLLFVTSAIDDEPVEYTAMVNRVMVGDELHNEKFFEGRMPEIGECVEYKYVGDTSDGGMRFQFKAKKCAEEQ